MYVHLPCVNVMHVMHFYTCNINKKIILCQHKIVLYSTSDCHQNCQNADKETFFVVITINVTKNTKINVTNYITCFHITG